MNTICKTCGMTLQSDISREYGQCGACRTALESAQVPQADRESADQRVPPGRQRGDTVKP